MLVLHEFWTTFVLSKSTKIFKHMSKIKIGINAAVLLNYEVRPYLYSSEHFTVILYIFKHCSNDLCQTFNSL